MIHDQHIGEHKRAAAAGLSPAGREGRREMFLPNKPNFEKQSHFRGRGETAGRALSAARAIIVAGRPGVAAPRGRGPGLEYDSFRQESGRMCCPDLNDAPRSFVKTGIHFRQMPSQQVTSCVHNVPCIWCPRKSWSRPQALPIRYTPPRREADPRWSRAPPSWRRMGRGGMRDKQQRRA